MPILSASQASTELALCQTGWKAVHFCPGERGWMGGGTWRREEGVTTVDFAATAVVPQ